MESKVGRRAQDGSPLVEMLILGNVPGILAAIVVAAADVSARANAIYTARAACGRPRSRLGRCGADDYLLGGCRCHTASNLLLARRRRGAVLRNRATGHLRQDQGWAPNPELDRSLDPTWFCARGVCCLSGTVCSGPAHASP